ncbi:hypothetical protein SASPL_152442 [Salvia splendens]|uniref:FAR1 domain-containing protein n=1 Tax=Salvia splendens TaxID=180675 RepID=A0A8X8W303_SALSN|nr:hypothetical protein SASPL_152442 [Salvia splendens]
MNDQLYIPQVVNDRKPKIGTKFESIDDAFEFYSQYAREASFSARYSNSRKNKMTNEVIWKQFVCFKAGQTDETCSKNRAPTGGPIQIRARGEVRTNCKAKISIVKQQTGSDWSVIVFMEDPKSRMAYGAFGDVVVFDSTFNTNNDEKTESYIWLLNKFMEAMPSDAPKAIITDQDPTMTKSIRNVIKNSTSPEEFENGWKEVIRCANLDIVNFLDEQLDYIHGKIKEMGISPTTIHGSQTRKSLDKTKTIGDPSKIRSKGCGKRMLSSKEKSILKTRACRGCGLRGASHDKPNCPKLQDRSVADDHHDISQYANERA